MHEFYENVAKYMFDHWTGAFFTDQTLNNEPYVLSKQIWTNIGKKMDHIRKTIPTALGRSPHNIILHHRGYKAEEWAVWITMYSLPLLKGYLPTRYYKG